MYSDNYLLGTYTPLTLPAGKSSHLLEMWTLYQICCGSSALSNGMLGTLALDQTTCWEHKCVSSYLLGKWMLSQVIYWECRHSTKSPVDVLFCKSGVLGTLPNYLLGTDISLKLPARKVNAQSSNLLGM